MRRCFIIGVCLALLGWTYGCSAVQQKPEEPEPCYRLADMVGKPDQMARVLKGVDAGRPAILRIDEGTQLPLQIALDAPLVRLSRKQVILPFVAARDFYIMLTREGARISLDAESWVDTKNLASVKSLLGFERGVFKLTLAPEGSGNSLFVLDISTE
jgi:hypothetical protein